MGPLDYTCKTLSDFEASLLKNTSVSREIQAIVVSLDIRTHLPIDPRPRQLHSREKVDK